MNDNELNRQQPDIESAATPAEAVETTFSTQALAVLKWIGHTAYENLFEHDLVN